MRTSKRSFLTHSPHAQDAVIKARIGIVLFLTILLVVLVLLFRFYFKLQEHIYFDDYFSFESDFIGSGVRELLMPIAFLAIFSNMGLFRRIVTTQADSRDQWRFIMVLGLIQLFTSFYNIGFLMTTGNIVTNGTFVTIVAGLLGGVRSGLMIASLTVFVESVFGFYALFPNILTTEDLNALIPLILLWNATILWGASLAGLLGNWLAQRRYQLLAMIGVDQVIVLVTFGVVFFAINDATFYLQRTVANLVVSAIGMTIFALLVRRVQAEGIEQQAKAAELALTQSHLALAEAELRTLRAQINPHFFFNSLNTIRYFIRTDPDTARHLLANLSEVFRRALYAGEFVTLADEIETVKAYLGLEAARLDERLQVIWQIAEEVDLQIKVPVLILQPIVENAIIHAIASQPAGGTLEITIKHVAHNLELQVKDNGQGFNAQPILASLDEPFSSSPSKERPSIGLCNIHQRLSRLYGEAYGLQIDSQIGQGTCVVVKIPLPTTHQPTNSPTH